MEYRLYSLYQVDKEQTMPLKLIIASSKSKVKKFTFFVFTQSVLKIFSTTNGKIDSLTRAYIDINKGDTYYTKSVYYYKV